VLPLGARRRLSSKLMEASTSELEAMIKDLNGNHVVQKLVERGFCDDMYALKKQYNNGIKAEMKEVLQKLQKLLDLLQQSI